MNRVPVLVRNPAFVEELEPDGDEVDPVDLAPCISGNTPIITSPASENKEVAGDEVGDAIRDLEKLIQDTEDDDEEKEMDNLLEELESKNAEAEELLKKMREYISSLPEDTGSKQHTVVPDVDVWDTGKAIEQEYRLYPDPTMKEVREGSPIRFGICSRYYRSGFTSIPTIVKILS